MSRMKKFRNKMGRQVIDGKISRAEALRRIQWEGRQRDAGPAATKAASSGTGRQQPGSGGTGVYSMKMQYARRLLNAAAAEPRDPRFRENIRPGGGTG